MIFKEKILLKYHKVKCDSRFRQQNLAVYDSKNQVELLAKINWRPETD